MATNRSGQAREANKSGDLKRRLVFLLLALVVFRIGTHIPVPGINPDAMSELFGGQEGGVLGLFNLFSGGALSRFSVFALGIMPYISASIIMQLLTVVVPSLDQIKKEGEAGRRIITKYTRWATLALATFQALGISVAWESQGNLVSDPGFMFRVVAVISLVTGTMFLMWLGEQITERGLGNGISLIISTYNRPRTLDRVLASVARQQEMPLQVLVADDGSGPETVQVVACWREHLGERLLHCWQPDEGFRLSAARNRAIREAWGDLLVFVDGDVRLPPAPHRPPSTTPRSLLLLD